MRIAVVGKNKSRCMAVAQMINTSAAGCSSIQAHPLPVSTSHYIQTPLAADVVAAFVLVNTMADVELVRKIAYLNRRVKLVIVSKSPEYGVEGFRIQAVDYLLEPLSSEDVEKALKRCLARPEEAL